MWTLGKEHGICTIQFMDHVRLKRNEDQSGGFSTAYKREQNNQGKQRVAGTWEEVKRGRENRNSYGRRWRRCTEGQEIKHRCVAMGDGELG